MQCVTAAGCGGLHQPPRALGPAKEGSPAQDVERARLQAPPQEDYLSHGLQRLARGGPPKTGTAPTVPRVCQ